LNRNLKVTSRQQLY